MKKLLILKISIDRENVAPGHGKYFVYGINITDKGSFRGGVIGYQIILPQLVKELVCFIMVEVSKLLVFHINARIF